MGEAKGNLSIALEYAQRGWAVFPLRAKDKRPATLHGFKDATKDPETIKKWWTNNPEFGIGIATGKVSNLLILDVDPRNEGHETLEGFEMELEHRGEPFKDINNSGLASRTGGYGLHFFYEYPEDTDVAPCITNLMPGFDIKADGGYIVAPPSIHPNGLKYHWLDGRGFSETGPGDMPSLLLDIIQHHYKTKARKTPEPVERTEEGDIIEGSRNDALTKLAGTMQRKGMVPEAIFAALMEENKASCRPPLDSGEVRAIVNSVARYEPEDPIVKSKPGPHKDLSFADTKQMLWAQPPPIGWLLEGWVAEGDCTILYGPPGCGKSWVTLDVALAMATGTSALDFFPPHEPMRVLIVDEENPGDEVNRRAFKVAKAMGLTDSEENREKLEQNLRFTTTRQGFNFADSAMRKRLMNAIEDFQPELIIFDSITALAGIENENDAKSVRAYFNKHLYEIQDKVDAQCTIISIHHTNKTSYDTDRTVNDAGLMRGSIDFQGAADSVICMLNKNKKEVETEMLSTKLRRGKTPAPLQIIVTDFPDGSTRPVALSTVKPVESTEIIRGAEAIPAPDIAQMTRPGTLQALLLSIVGGTPGMVPKQIHSLVGHCEDFSRTSKQVIYRSLTVLVEKGQLRKERQGSLTRYYPVEM